MNLMRKKLSMMLNGQIKMAKPIIKLHLLLKKELKFGNSDL